MCTLQRTFLGTNKTLLSQMSRRGLQLSPRTAFASTLFEVKSTLTTFQAWTRTVLGRLHWKIQLLQEYNQPKLKINDNPLGQSIKSIGGGIHQSTKCASFHFLKMMCCQNLESNNYGVLEFLTVAQAVEGDLFFSFGGKNVSVLACFGFLNQAGNIIHFHQSLNG